MTGLTAPECRGFAPWTSVASLRVPAMSLDPCLHVCSDWRPWTVVEPLGEVSKHGTRSSWSGLASLSRLHPRGGLTATGRPVNRTTGFGKQIRRRWSSPLAIRGQVADRRDGGTVARRVREFPASVQRIRRARRRLTGEIGGSDTEMMRLSEFRGGKSSAGRPTALIRITGGL